MSFKISAPNSSNKTQWLELWQDYLVFYKEDLPSEITQLTWQRILDINEPVNAFIIYNDNEVVGFTHYLFHRSTWAKNNYCYLEDLFVTEKVRGKGCASALINAVREAAKQNNCERLYWVTGESNTVARSLYDKMAEKTEYFQYRLGVE